MARCDARTQGNPPLAIVAPNATAESPGGEARKAKKENYEYGCMKERASERASDREGGRRRKATTQCR